MLNLIYIYRYIKFKYQRNILQLHYMLSFKSQINYIDVDYNFCTNNLSYYNIELKFKLVLSQTYFKQ